MDQGTASEVPPDPPCKRVLALLAPDPSWDAGLCAALESAFGPMDFRGPFQPFEGTDYYAAEMGSTLYRALASFRGLGAPQALPEWKAAARELEGRFARADGRRVYNLDVGYLDPDKLVLASCKRGPCKIYLGRGVWADMLLAYAKGDFRPTEWAFADFRDGRYNKALGSIREKLKAEMRK